ncbi:MAG TPA: hypothetical protein VD994_08965 [Prosthecobacter sp.]|nr:hypothetical protein [Prosthecobacter sp.]
MTIARICSVFAVLHAVAWSGDPRVEVTPLTSGPKHHLFGYIGHVQTIPWSGDGRYIVALRTTFQDHLPGPEEPAEIVLIDTRQGNAVTVVEHSRAWNPQQGTMLYWNPLKPETQFFFNDRDPNTQEVFCVLYDIERKRRVKEYRHAETPFGNSGVAQQGGWFLGINYGRMARLRPVTGYARARDWTVGVAQPEDDGIFKVNAETGETRLLVSFKQLAAALKTEHPEVEGKDSGEILTRKSGATFRV